MFFDKLDDRNVIPAMRTKPNIVIIHIVCCLAFLSIPLLSPPPNAMGDGLIKGMGHLKDIFGYSIALVFFYACYYFIIPRYYFSRKWGGFALSLLLGLVVIILLPNLLFFSDMAQHGPPMNMPGRFPNPPPGDMPDMAQHGPHHSGWHPLFGAFEHNMFRFVIVVAVSLLLKINSQYRKAEQEKAETEISFLKAQINPHFLFNTLNSIYSLAITKSDATAEAVVKLSALMRYSISDAIEQFVSLGKEIDYISNYIQLQRLRVADKVKLKYEVTGTPGTKRISPFLLIPFVENAFKYGVNPEEDCEITVLIFIGEDDVELQVFNKKVYVQSSKDTGLALGIDNTRKRLQMLYPSRHQLLVREDFDSFEVRLKITLA
ncbi:MAG: histidine kinase [Sphingobacteriales bacterium]|nr:MAG: histidine kinase [Sphingobacteriales bacterium]